MNEIRDILKRERINIKYTDIVEMFTYASDLAGMTSLEAWIEERGEDLIGRFLENHTEEEKQERYQRYYSQCVKYDKELHRVFNEEVYEELYELIIG